MQINELKAFAKKVDLVAKAIKKNEVREVESKSDQSKHKVTEMLIGDATGVCLLTLWDDGIDKVEEGKTYKIGNGYTNLFQRKIRLNLGRYGTIEETTDDVGTINEENNISEKEQEFQPRPYRSGGYGGGGGGGGGFRGGGGGGYGGFRDRDSSDRPPRRDRDSTGKGKGGQSPHDQDTGDYGMNDEEY